MFRKKSSEEDGSRSPQLSLTFDQLLKLFVVMALLLFAFPVGAQAAGSLMTLVDSTTSTKARVDPATSALRVGGITNKLLDETGTISKTFTFPSAAYSHIRIFAEHSGCSGYCDTLTVECVESGNRTCILLADQSFDENGYNALSDVPGRTLRVRVNTWFGVGSWHVVVYGRAP